MTRPFKIGLQLPEVEYVARWSDYLEMARLAEAIGLDSLWLGDHLLYRNPGEAARAPWECLSLLSALAVAIVIALMLASAVQAGFGGRPELIGDPDRPALHGGVLSAVADTCGGCAVWSAVGADDRVSTIDLRIDYLRPGQPEELRCIGNVLRVGNRVGVAQITLFHPSASDVPIAEAKGVYSVKRAAA